MATKDMWENKPRLGKKHTFQVASDLHLEMRPSASFGGFLTPCAENLILAGDIGDPFSGTYESFLIWAKERWVRVIVVLGNHEYYRTFSVGANVIPLSSKRSMQDVEDRLLQLEKRHGIYFMQKKVLRIDHDIVLIGATLWSHIPPEAEEDCKECVTDFELITDMDVGMFNYLHQDHKNWLANNIKFAKSNGDTVVVVTHHTPIVDFVNKREHIGTTTNHTYSTFLPDLLAQADYWICGHTHTCTLFEYFVDEEDPHSHICTIIMNCGGYPKEKTGYSPKLTFEIQNELD